MFKREKKTKKTPWSNSNEQEYTNDDITSWKKEKPQSKQKIGS